MKPPDTSKMAWWGIAVALALGGISLAVTVHPWVGFPLIVLAGFVMPITESKARQAPMRRRQKIKLVGATVRELHGHGNKLLQAMPSLISWDGTDRHMTITAASAASEREAIDKWRSDVEDWRGLIDFLLGRYPFKRDTDRVVLTEGGDRLSEPLTNLRAILAAPEKWIEEEVGD